MTSSTVWARNNMGSKMTDFITIVIAILAIVLIMKIATKLLKFILTIVVIGIVLYVLANYGFKRLFELIVRRCHI